jgi:hypothetical protein
MRDDPIVQEVRQARERFAAAFGYDIDRIFAEIKRLEARHPSRFLRPRARAAATTAPATPTPVPGVAEAPGRYATPTGPKGRKRSLTKKEAPST